MRLHFIFHALFYGFITPNVVWIISVIQPFQRKKGHYLKRILVSNCHIYYNTQSKQNVLVIAKPIYNSQVFIKYKTINKHIIDSRFIPFKKSRPSMNEDLCSL